MPFSPDVSLKIKNYKSFGDEAQGFERVAPINIIIGRNNSGKSALLDLVDYATAPKDIAHLGHIGQMPEAYLTSSLTDAEISSVFPNNTQGGPIGGNYYDYGRAWIGKALTVELKANGGKVYAHLGPDVHPDFKANLAQRLLNPFVQREFRRIDAERDVKVEQTMNLSLEADGTGVTNLIQHFLYNKSGDQDLVEIQLLAALNRIFSPDVVFTRIEAKRPQDNGPHWEIYLEEKNKGRIPLSNSGSGLKTIIQVLAQTILIPELEKRELSKYIFGFEELENNLHPGLQRRLFTYIRELAIEHDSTFFITTHSNVIIDLFADDSEAQLIHVIHNGERAIVKTIRAYSGSSDILDDLDVRASDLLQANGVIWVEGPSDRVYLNRYIDLCSDGKLKEGLHYQCVFYGGRLLARATADPENNEPMNLLKVNRHCSLVMDSDKASESDAINSTKTRMKSEVESAKGYVWTTDGREIENAIPLAALRAIYGAEISAPISQYQEFDEYLDSIKPGECKAFLKSKVLFAERICPLITVDMIQADEKLWGHIDKLCRLIGSWNG